MLTIKKFDEVDHPYLSGINSYNGGNYVFEGNGANGISRGDPDSNGATSWVSTKVVRKEGSAPINSNDGVLLINNTTKNAYRTSTAFEDTGLTNGTKYYYRFFTVDNYGREVGSQVFECTPDILCSELYLSLIIGGPGGGYTAIYPTNTTAVLNELNSSKKTDYYNKFADDLFSVTTSESGTVTNILTYSGSTGMSFQCIRRNGSSREVAR